MTRTAVLGFPRIGADRELKLALEDHWAGRSSPTDLEQIARELRAENLRRGADAGIDVLPVGDFALYDHLLDTAEMTGIVADRHRSAGANELAPHFLACRGGDDVTPLEMTKWFDTNYHYLVPELRDNQRFALRADKWLAHLREARELGHTPRPVVVGPLTLLLIAKGTKDPLALLPALGDVYGELLDMFAAEGVTEVQLDEPALVGDRSEKDLNAFATAYASLSRPDRPGIALATYFGGLDGPTLARISSLDIAELHVDLVRDPGQLEPVLATLPDGTRLSAGVVDGRNIWRTDLDRALDLLDHVVSHIGSDRLTIATSCSLLHVPYSAQRETGLDEQLRSWLAFGDEKLAELSLLADALEAGKDARDSLLAPTRTAIASRRSSPRTNDAAVRSRVAGLSAGDHVRPAPIAVRLEAQAARLRLPELPTTTIGSFPQTPEIRSMRARRRSGEATLAEYEAFMREQVADVIREQEALDFDVLVHGEPERNDMVEYFGEQLEGFAFSDWGWVQSYGSRCVKPPILYGDVSRPRPMTVDWWSYAQSLTERPVKGMLTGPVTILQWSFVRDDQPRRETCMQIALAIQDEVRDLEAAGAKVIQVDEAALREGLPLRRTDRGDYLRWAVDAFRLTVAPARTDTQIHTHMCYSEFGEMLEDIARMDADVISIEASRSDMELLESLRDFDYPGEIGPGVYDIHSPRVPSIREIEELLAAAERHVPREQLWVNPDCGLKTRGWNETRLALGNVVEAARRRRAANAAAVE